ncbi:hypothetical protein TNCV_1090191 [Trichonephila clavipes]|uniref:Uncharacterized protein n=1 Tax=Trichonephila clavipes TaxID=2585209 RepID=A0A8X6VQG4_TRICX|nr:hypothetical protein TNCV_1090191 [Trichonephila clavipes]
MLVQHGDTLNNNQATSPLVRLAKGEERWKNPGHLQEVLPQNKGGTKSNHTITCMVLKTTTNDGDNYVKFYYRFWKIVDF